MSLENMYLESIKNLHREVKELDHYKSKGKVAKEICIDRYNLVIHLIVIRNKHVKEVKNYEMVEMSSRYLISMLDAREYKIIITNLRQMGILEVDDSYLTAALCKKIYKETGVEVLPYSKKYGLSDYAKSLDIIHVGVLSERTKLRYRKHLKNKYDRMQKNPINKRIMGDILKLNFIGTKELLNREYDKDKPNQKKYYEFSFRELQEMNKVNGYKSTTELAELPFYHYNSENKVNRVFHNYANVPSEFRYHLMHKDKSALAEIDRSNSQPSLIVMNFYKDLKNGELGLNNTSSTSSVDSLIRSIYSLDNNDVGDDWYNQLDNTNNTAHDTFSDNDNTNNTISDLNTNEYNYAFKNAGFGSTFLGQESTSDNLSEKSTKNTNNSLKIEAKEKGGDIGGEGTRGICVAEIRNDDVLENFINQLENLCDNKDASQIIWDVLDGVFYKRVAEQALKDGDTDFYNLFTDDYSEFKSKVLGQGLYFILIPVEEVKPSEKYLMELYPTFMSWLRERKYKTDYKTISIEAQRLESDIFIRQLYTDLDEDKFAIPIHDSIICKVEDVEFFRNRLIKIVQDTFSDFPPSLFEDIFKVKEYIDHK